MYMGMLSCVVGPNQNKLFNQGNAYIRRDFPLVDFLQECSEIVEERTQEEEEKAEEGEDVESIEEVEEKLREMEAEEADAELAVPDNEIEPEEEEDDEEEEAEQRHVVGGTTIHKSSRLKGTLSTVLPVYIGFIACIGLILGYMYRKSFIRSPFNKRV